MNEQTNSGEVSRRSGGASAFPPPTGYPVDSREYAMALQRSGGYRAAVPQGAKNQRSTRVRRPIAAALITTAIGAVLLYPYGLRSVAVALAFAAIFVVAIAVLYTKRDAVTLGVVAAVALLPWLAIRASPWLLSLDLIAFFGVATHVFSRRTPMFRRSLGGYLLQWADGFVFGIVGPAFFVKAVTSGGRSTRRAGDIAKIAVVPVVVFLVVVGLLAAGDQLFASYFSFLQLDTLIARLFFGVAALLLFMGAVGVASRPASRDAAAAEVRWSVPSAPVLMTLVGLAIALVAYAAVQLSAAAYGADYVTDRTGLTFAEWARRGFLAMSVVAVIAAIALGTASLSAARHRERRRSTQVAATIVTLGVIGVAMSSIIKLSVYADQYGLTMLRVYTITFTGWMALVTIFQLASIWRPGGGWLTTVVLVSALVGVFAMNVVNPELMVMRHNLDRFEAGEVAPGGGSCDRVRGCTDEFDVWYALRLSEDAYPELLDRLDVLSPYQRESVLDELCRGRYNWTTGLNYNRALNETRLALRNACG